MKPLPQRATKEASLELREVSTSRSKPPVSLLQWHRQCDDLLIALPTSEPVRLPVHVQLVSLLQRHRQCDDLLIALPTSEPIRLPVHVQLVSLLQ